MSSIHTEELHSLSSIQVQQLSVSYHGKQVFKPSSVTLEQGKLIGIIGPNGAGKSTFLKGIMGLIPIDSGEIRIFNQAVKKVRKRIAYVPQRSDIDWDFPVLVKDVVMMGRYPLMGWFRREKEKDRQIVSAALEKVGLTSLAKRQIGQLSGGQQQRVFLARALAQEADLFLLDEPFVGVDVATEQIILAQLRQLISEGKTIVVVHHDLSKATHYFDRLLLINQEIIGYGPSEEMFQPEWLDRTYGNQLTMIHKENQVMVINQ